MKTKDLLMRNGVANQRNAVRLLGILVLLMLYLHALGQQEEPRELPDHKCVLRPAGYLWQQNSCLQSIEPNPAPTEAYTLFGCSGGCLRGKTDQDIYICEFNRGTSCLMRQMGSFEIRVTEIADCEPAGSGCDCIDWRPADPSTPPRLIFYPDCSAPPQ